MEVQAIISRLPANGLNVGYTNDCIFSKDSSMFKVFQNICNTKNIVQYNMLCQSPLTGYLLNPFASIVVGGGGGYFALQRRSHKYPAP